MCTALTRSIDPTWNCWLSLSFCYVCWCLCSPGGAPGLPLPRFPDVNECLLNNGHGPCEDTCRNLEGSYACACDGLSGTKLASDNHTCRDDVGQCTINNAGCSHTCLTTMGRVFCLCPDGFVLADDWKTCQGHLTTLHQMISWVTFVKLLNLKPLSSNLLIH